MSSKKRLHQELGQEAPGPTESPGDGKEIKRQKANNEALAAPENPNPAPDDWVANPGSNANIPWSGLLRPLPLINAVHLESVSAKFQEFVFSGHHRLVWNFTYRNCLVANHGLAFSQTDYALLFLATKIGPFCRQLIIKDFEHPQSNNQEIFTNLRKLESVYLKYGKPAGMKGDLTLNVMDESFQSFFANAQTTLAALRNTVKAEIRIHVDARECPKKLLGQAKLGKALKSFSVFLAERKESLISLQLTPFEKYSKRTGEGTHFQLNLNTLRLPNGDFHLRKFRTVFTREKPEISSQLLQYSDALKAVNGHLDTLYIKWEEEKEFNLHVDDYKFLGAFYPLWSNRIVNHSSPLPIPLQALALDFKWVNVSFASEELHPTLFDRYWKYLGEKLGKLLREDKFKKLSLALPTSPKAQEQGCFYFSEAFIQVFVQNRSLDYLRLVFKAMPGVALKFGLVKLATLEISFSCLKAEKFSQELVQAAKNVPGILFDLECDFWKASSFAGSVRSLKLKYAPYFDKDLATHLATAFPKLAKFSFTAFHRQVYNQGDFILGLRELLEKIPTLRVIKLGDSFDKRHLNLAEILRDMQERANNDTRNKFVFYARKATLDERSQTVLDNSRQVGSNFRITIETFPRTQVQEEMHRNVPPALQSQFPNEGLQNSPSLPVNQPEYPNVGIHQENYPLNPSGPISHQTFNCAPNVQLVANVPSTQQTYQFQEFMQQPHQYPNERLQNAPLHGFQNAPGLIYPAIPPQASPQPFLIQRGPAVTSGFFPNHLPQNQQSNGSGFYNCPQSAGGNPSMNPSGYMVHPNLNYPQNMHPAANISGNQAAYPFSVVGHQQHQFSNQMLHHSQSFLVNLDQNSLVGTYEQPPLQTPLQPHPQQFLIQTNPAVASSHAPLPESFPQAAPDLFFLNHFPANYPPAANIPGNQAVYPFPVQQAANQGQPSPPSPGAESPSRDERF